jgi:thiol-disulfide isomerase/thioredoxin
MKSRNQSSKKNWNLTRIGLIGSALVLLAAIAYTYYQDPDSGQTAPNPTANTVGGKAASSTNAPVGAGTATPSTSLFLPESVMQAEISLLDGRKKKLADYAGKVLIIDLWATWCGPCRQEIPHLIQIASEYKSKGVEVIGLTNENPQTDAQLVKDFSREFKINYPIGWADMPMQIGLMQGRAGIPQTLIIGRDGKIRHHFVGFNAAISVPQMKAAVEAAVAAG